MSRTFVVAHNAGQQILMCHCRVTPLVAYLNSHQRTWLANQLFMEAAEKNIADPDWDSYMKDKVCAFHIIHQQLHTRGAQFVQLGQDL
jgi:hypothetical protein